MSITIELPHVGESVVEGTIGKWLKQPGENVKRYEPLVEIITDKVTMEVPSPVEGSLVRVLAEEGDTLPMGAAIAEVATADSPEGAETQTASIAIERPGDKKLNSLFVLAAAHFIRPIALTNCLQL